LAPVHSAWLKETHILLLKNVDLSGDPCTIAWPKMVVEEERNKYHEHYSAIEGRLIVHHANLAAEEYSSHWQVMNL
jgi:hypothetical protein